MNRFEQAASDTDSGEKERILLERIHTFVFENRMKSEEVEEAMFREVDESGNPTQVPETDDVVSRLAEMFAEAHRQGVPFNEVIGVLRVRQLVEDAPKRFDALLGTLRTDDRSKEVLRSVVEKGRAGTITLIDPKTGKELDLMRLQPQFKTADRVYRAQELIFSLSGSKVVRFGFPFEISFEEV
jgi:hypothetical protein